MTPRGRRPYGVRHAGADTRFGRARRPGGAVILRVREPEPNGVGVRALRNPRPVRCAACRARSFPGMAHRRHLSFARASVWRPFDLLGARGGGALFVVSGHVLRPLGRRVPMLMSPLCLASLGRGERVTPTDKWITSPESVRRRTAAGCPVQCCRGDRIPDRGKRAARSSRRPAAYPDSAAARAFNQRRAADTAIIGSSAGVPLPEIARHDRVR